LPEAGIKQNTTAFNMSTLLQYQQQWPKIITLTVMVVLQSSSHCCCTYNNTTK